MQKQLKRTKQCSGCPWRVGSTREAIHSYSEELHARLHSTIAKEDPYDENGQIKLSSLQVKMMTCHKSTEESDPEVCVGWLVNQEQRNNLSLRLYLMGFSNLAEIEVFGPQHEAIDDFFS